MTAPKKPPNKPSKKPGMKSARPRTALDPALSIPPADDLKGPAGTTPTGKDKPGAEAAAEALERLSKMTPEEQAAALFQTILASSGKKSW